MSDSCFCEYFLITIVFLSIYHLICSLKILDSLTTEIISTKQGRNIIICPDTVIIMEKGQGATTDPRRPMQVQEGWDFLSCLP